MRHLAPSVGFQKRLASGVAAACVGLVGVAVVGAEAASAQTVIVGTSQVPVSSNGTVTIDGTAIPVPAGFAGHVSLVTPPPGSPVSTVDGQQEYGLPAGATGESFNLLPADSTAATVQAVPITSQPSQSAASSPVTQPDASGTGGFCDMYADDPWAPGDEVIEGDTATDCTTGDALVVDVNSTMYELLDEGWETRGSGDNYGGENEFIEAEAFWDCTYNTTHTWHDRNNTQVEDYTEDWIYGWYLNGDSSDPTCR